MINQIMIISGIQIQSCGFIRNTWRERRCLFSGGVLSAQSLRFKYCLEI